MIEIGLDMIASLFCGAIAVTLFALHAITSPRHEHWITPPAHLRLGILATGVLFMVRSVNLITLPPYPEVVRGHVNLEGVLVAGLLLYVLLSATIWISELLRARHDARIPLRHD